MEKKLTEIFGLTLESEYLDKGLYDTVRSLQFLFLKSYDLGRDLIISETQKDKFFVYKISNNKLGLLGFVGRDSKNGKIIYLVKDESRIRWARSEGFDTTDSKVLNSIGFMANCKRMNDFILFMAGKKGWEFSGYART